MNLLFPGRIVACVALVSLLATNASAHPGHSYEIVSASSSAHYLLQPGHGVLIVAAGLFLAVTYRGLLRRRRMAV